MPSPSSGYATPAALSEDEPATEADPPHPVGQALGQALSDVLASLVDGMPSGSGEEGVVDLDVDALLDSPGAGPGPSTAAFWAAKAHGPSSGFLAAGLDIRGSDSGDPLDLNGHIDGNYSDALSDEQEEGEEVDRQYEGEDDGEDDQDEQPEQLDKVLEDDQMFYDVLVHDLKECIDEAGWTLALWKSVFIEEYGWDPEPLLDKYGAIARAAIPAFAAKLDMLAARVDKEEHVAGSDSRAARNKEHEADAFQRVLREVKAWNWNDPASTKKRFRESYKQKYGSYPDYVFSHHRARLKTMVPAFAARMKANVGGNRRPNRMPSPSPKPNPPLHGPTFDTLLQRHDPVPPDQLPSVRAVALHMQEWDWDHPHISNKEWWEAFVTEYHCTPNDVLELHRPLIQELVPALGRRAGMIPEPGERNALSPSMMLENDAPLSPSPARTPRHRLPASHGRPISLAERQAGSGKLDAAAQQVSAAYRETFVVLVDQMNDFDWTCEGDAMERFRDHCKRRKVNTGGLTRVIGHYGSLLRRCCPAFATRMDEDRLTGMHTARGTRRVNGYSHRATSSERGFQMLSHYPSPNASPAAAPRRRTPEQERTPRPRLAPYVKPPRREGPLSFPSALAELDVEVYRHRSNSTLLPQLPLFSDYLSSEARGKYDALIVRIHELDSAIDARLSDLRVMAKDVDRLQAAVTDEWAALQASSSGETADTAMDVDAGPTLAQEWEDKQAAAVARRNMLLGHRVELGRMRDERAKCLAGVRRVDEIVVAARAKIEAALMDEECVALD